MRSVGLVVGLLAVPLAAALSVSRARGEEPPVDPAFDVQLFEYAVGPKDFFSVPNAEVPTHMQFQVDMMLTYLTNPLVISSFDENSGEVTTDRTDVVESLLAGQLGAAIGFRDRFQFGVAVPIIFSLSGEGLDPGTGNMSPGGLQATGLGDIRGEAKVRLAETSGLTASALAQISLPTSVGSGGSMFLGDNTPGARFAGVGQWRSDDRKATVGASAGLLFRKPRTLYDAELGQQITYGLAASYRVHRKVSLAAETFGRVGFSFTGDSTPLEAIGGAKLQASDALSVVLGGGAGVLPGVGSPGLRMFLSVGYAPDFRDQDGDGIPNNKDRCPLAAEDRDGFEDEDGCPDDDNDGDQRPDASDQCPMEAEDLDGYLDDDGCPEADNDGDGFLDGVDKCPTDAEDGVLPLTTDGCPASMTDSDDDGIFDDRDRCPTDAEDADAFEDEDGCPEPDNDNDGVLDDDDECPVCAEDQDGFEDEDGCPDPDNDADGIADAVDQCPLEPETINGSDDDDGCPDSGGRALAAFDGEKIALGAPITFSRSGKLRSVKVVDQLALVMKAAATVKKWRIVVVAPVNRDPELHKVTSQEHADALKDLLVARGVSAAIEAIGVAAQAPLTAIIALEKKSGPSPDVCTE